MSSTLTGRQQRLLAQSIVEQRLGSDVAVLVGLQVREQTQGAAGPLTHVATLRWTQGGDDRRTFPEVCEELIRLGAHRQSYILKRPSP
jgi:hypothetical protein